MIKKSIMGFWGIVLLIAAWPLYAEIATQVDPQKVTIDETFRLIFTVADKRSDKIPDLTPLQNDFTIVATERSMSYTIINGEARAKLQWIIVLKPKKQGILTIPQIDFGTLKSQAVRVEVAGLQGRQQETIPASQVEKVMLKTAANPKDAYVNQQIMYTVKLYSSGRFLDAEYHPPRVEDALLITLGDTRSYQTIENGTNYVVEEQQYAVFPQKSGELTITGPAFNALIYEGIPKQVNIKPNKTKLAVKPVPASYQGQHWLPAKAVRLKEQYNNESRHAKEGSTFTRTITLETTGLPAQLVPKLELASHQSYHVYPEKPEEQNIIRNGELVGKTRVKATYILKQAGEVTIPELKLIWFNTNTQQQETAILPAKTIRVAKGQERQIPHESKTALNEDNHDRASLAPHSDKTMPKVASFVGSLVWRLVLIVVLIVAFTMMLWRMRSFYHSRKAKKEALKRLKIACNRNEPALARDALLVWAKLNWPDADILSLNELPKLTMDRKFQKHCRMLAKALYSGGNGQEPWQGAELWAAVRSLRMSRSMSGKKASNLPPINPV